MRSGIFIASVVAIVVATAGHAQAPELQQQIDLMQLADANGDGKVTLEEYQAFTEQGWDFVSQGADKVKISDLDDQAKLVFFGIQPDAQGYVTHKMYLDAAPARFKLFDTDKNGSLNADEINGRTLQQN
jgi:Ca2+-binding EF-hand superfamily protein